MQGTLSITLIYGTEKSDLESRPPSGNLRPAGRIRPVTSFCPARRAIWVNLKYTTFVKLNLAKCFNQRSRPVIVTIQINR